MTSIIFFILGKLVNFWPPIVMTSIIFFILGKLVNFWPPVVFTSTIFSTFFFATGHQATVPAIRWESAFTGFHGDFSNNIVPAMLITLNTFAAEVFYCILCPLIVIWPLTDGIFLKSLITKKEEPGQWKGDFILFEDEDMFKQLLFRLFSSMFLFQGIKVTRILPIFTYIPLYFYMKVVYKQ
jgi:hypothetical protein